MTAPPRYPMLGYNFRVGGYDQPMTIRLPDDLIEALDEVSLAGWHSPSDFIRDTLDAYFRSNPYPGPTTYDKLLTAATDQQRSVRGLIRNILRLDLAQRGVLEYTDVPDRLAL